MTDPNPNTIDDPDEDEGTDDEAPDNDPFPEPPRATDVSQYEPDETGGEG